MSDDAPLGFRASDISPRTGSAYPAEFAGRVAGREKRVLGNPFGLTNFGVNCTTLKPGAESALMHRHKTQDEFVYILEGTATLVTDRGEMDLSPGMCAGFPKGGLAHHLVNRSSSDVVYLEIGDRSPGDEGSYPADDLKAVQDEAGKWQFLHKDGTPY
ncbi:MAG: cupin domain-containing protein [Notoacmeibacter sp.]|nr:cupin domain-containing protein [Notoacmeibacter sp.]MCC0032014.1 cupin domain-containing protein [Brucellaceae bacterium]